MEQLETDTVVIGAGVIGLAVARRLAQLGQDVVVVEAGDHFGEGISSRNSEVIHAGIYYPQDSLKSRLCIAGRHALYDYCQHHSVAHRKTGKWIIACQESQREALAQIQRQAARNGVSLIGSEGRALARTLPGITAVGGLYSTETGIVDSHGLMLSLLGELETAGGQLAYRSPVQQATSASTGHQLIIGGDMPCQLNARRVINAAGLGAVPLARTWQGFPAAHCPELYLARGCYFSYSGRHPFNTLIYPMPEPGGLGVHLTLDLAGSARFGPDVEWIDTIDYRVDPARGSRFADAIRQWWPGLDETRLQPSYAGIRPKLAGPGQDFTDFTIQDETTHGLPGLIQLFGIESPGLTASLAMADYIAERLA